MFKYSYQAGCLWGNVYESIERIGKLGYDAVEVAGVTSYFCEADKIKAAAERAGLEISSICTMCQECDLAFPRPEERQKAIDYMCRVVDFAHALGCHRVVINPTRLTKWTPLAPIEDELRWGAESVAKVADYAKEKDVILCVECWNRYDTYLINTAEEGRKFVDMVDRDNVGVMLDTFHLNIEEVDMAAAIYATKGKLVHIHIGDSNRQAPGMGHTDFVPLMQALKDIDYSGYCTMELVPPAADPDTYEDMHDMRYFLEDYPAVSIKYLKEIEAKLK